MLSTPFKVRFPVRRIPPPTESVPGSRIAPDSTVTALFVAPLPPSAAPLSTVIAPGEALPVTMLKSQVKLSLALFPFGPTAK